VTGISAGTCDIIYTITGGCGGIVSAQQSVTINPDAAIATVTGSSPLCIGGTSVYTANGVLLSGGTGAWSSSNPSVATVSATGLVTGMSVGTCNIIYTITGGCGGIVSAQQSVTINPNATIASMTSTSPLCIGGTSVYTANGVILSGGTGEWSSSNPSIATVDATGLVTGISAGSCNIIYTITGGCGGTASAQQSLVINPNVAVASVTGSSPMCIGGSTIYTANGVVLSGGTGAWSSSNPLIASVDVTGLVTGLSVGTCDIIYTISGGCGGSASAFRSITITTAPAASISYTGSPWCSNTGIQNVILTGTLGGTFSASPAGLGIDPVTGVIDPGASLPGTYTITYSISVVGCGVVTATTSVTINQAPTVVITDPAQVCSPATIDLTVSAVTAGSTSGLTFTYWTDAAATIVLGTPAMVTTGVYYIKGTDGLGCYDIKPVNATVNPLPSITGTQTDILCFGANTGAIDITVTGGSIPYTFAWTGTGVTTISEDQINLTAGLYSVVVTDANICSSASFQVTLTEPTALTGSISSQTNVTAFGGNDGSVTVVGTGGIPPYLYKIGSGIYQASGTFGTLSAGSYIVTVQDFNLCTFDVPVNITQPLPPLAGSIVSQINVLCYGTSTGSVTVQGSGGLAPYDYSLNGGVFQVSGTFGTLASGNYTITVRDAVLNTFDVSATITQPSAALGGSITSQTDILCFGNNTGSITVSGTGGISPYQYKLSAGSYQASGTFTSLTAGVYTVTIQDANLCTYDVPVTLIQPAAKLTGSIISQQNVTCSGSVNGSVSVAGAGGTSPYEYRLDGGVYQVSGAFNGLARGNYSVDIRDANLCTVTVPVAISEPAVLSIAPDKTDASCPGVNDGSITLTITGGTQPYTVIWSDGFMTATRSNIPDGTYSAVVTDINGCATSIDIIVGVVGTERCLEVQGIITPNNDGFNDTWKIKNIDLFPNAEVFVFNRWGQLVFNTKNISENQWDGTSNGKLLPTDSYHYTLHLNDGSEPRSGVVSIIR
jgi:gliding motility-associated-like protein